MRRAALVFGAAVLVLATLFVARPWLAKKRDFAASVPSPAALRSTASVTLRAGHPVCFSSVAIEQHSSQLRFAVAAGNHPGPPLEVAIRGPGYRADVPIAPGYVNDQLVAAPVPVPAGPLRVRVCVRNRGGATIGLLASDDRTRSRSTASVDGRSTEKSVWFGFYEAMPQTIPDRFTAIVARMAVFRPGYVTRGVLWALIVLMALGVPLAAVWAFKRALADDEATAGDPIDVRQRRSVWRRVVG